jgi:uncharacterized protein (TIGR00369 family)
MPEPLRLTLPIDLPTPGPLMDRGMHAWLGYRVLEWEEARAVTEMTLAERHLNTFDAAQGGLLCSLIDIACGLVCAWVPRGPVPGLATIALNTHFVASAGAGAVLTTTATLEGGGHRTKQASAEIRDADGALVALGSGAFARRG